MTYIYVCDPCKTGFHADCLNHQDQLPLAEEDSGAFFGYGMCMCDHRANHQTVEEALESRRENTKRDS